jgi:hypothetical protein
VETTLENTRRNGAISLVRKSGITDGKELKREYHEIRVDKEGGFNGG